MAAVTRENAIDMGRISPVAVIQVGQNVHRISRFPFNL